MDRVARLVFAGETLQRRIWASLTPGVRLAHVLFRLFTAGTEDDFGTAVYHYLQVAWKNAGVDFPADWRSRAKAFGHKAAAILMKTHRNPQAVKEIMSRFLLRVVEKKGFLKVDPHRGLEEAEKYVTKGLVNEGLNLLDHVKRKRENSMSVRNDEGEETTLDVPVLHHFEDLEKLTPGIVQNLFHDRAVKHELDKVHPDALLYLELLLDGHPENKIVGDPSKGVPSMLPHPVNRSGDPLNPSSWNKTYGPGIMRVLQKHLADEMS